MDERGKEIGLAIEHLWSELSAVRRGANWERKLEGASYVHHRDDYEGTEVPRRETYDDSARNFLDTFCDGYVCYLMPQDDQWAELIPWSAGAGEMRRRRQEYSDISGLDAVPGLLKYNELVSSAVLTQYADSNYYSEVLEAARDFFVLGTCFMKAEEDAAEGEIWYRCIDPQEAVSAEDMRGRVNVVVRKFRCDARDLLERAPQLKRIRDIVSAGIGERSMIDCYEAYLPAGYLYSRGERLELRTGGKPWAYVLYVPIEGEIADERGLDWFPIAVARDRKDNNVTAWGNSLVEANLATIARLDDNARNRMEMAQKNADPPMWVHMSMQGNYSSGPGAQNYGADPAMKPAPIFEGSDYSQLLADIQDDREQLRRNLGADLFRTILSSTDSRKTAYEVSELKNESQALLMMRIGMFKKELMEPMFMHTAMLLEKQGRIKSVAEAVDGVFPGTVDRAGRSVRTGALVSMETYLRSCRMELTSPFIQRLAAYMRQTGLVNGISALGTLMQIFPSASANIKENATVRQFLYAAGFPKSCIEELAETARKQEDYRQMTMQQYQAQQAGVQADAYKKAAEGQQALRMGGTA